MTDHPTPIVLTALLCAGLLSGCGGSDTPAASATPDPPAETAQLPPGHPPVDAGAPADAMPPVPAGSGSGAAALRWAAPAAWVEEQPSSSMRRAQYRVPGDAGDAQCVVYYFGPGQGGDAESNADRWGQQFTRPDGGSPADALVKRQIDVGGIPVLLAETTGTYNGGFMAGGSGDTLEGQMLLGAIAEGPDANWFFKLTGPEATVRAHREAFEGMIGSLERGK